MSNEEMDAFQKQTMFDDAVNLIVEIELSGGDGVEKFLAAVNNVINAQLATIGE